MMQILKSILKSILLTFGIALAFFIGRQSYQPSHTDDYDKIRQKAEKRVKEEQKIPEINYDNGLDAGPMGEEPVIEDNSVKSEGSTKPEIPSAERMDETAFSSRYAYTTLNDEQKILYNEMYTAIFAYKRSVMLATKDKDILAPVYYAIMADCPELFWVNGYKSITYTTDGIVTGIEFKPEYIFSQEEADSYQRAIDESTESFLSGISMNATDYEKSKYVYTVLINNVEYDSSSQNNQNIVSVFINGKTVCKGYASAAQFLLSKLGIESVTVKGEANGEMHAWNLVKLDGLWYHYDVTWGNGSYRTEKKDVKKYVDYAYLNISDGEINKTHRITESFPVPECNSDMDSYYVKEGLLVTEYDENQIGDILGSAFESGIAARLKFASEGMYGLFKDEFLDGKKLVKYCPGLTEWFYTEDKTSLSFMVEFSQILK